MKFELVSEHLVPFSKYDSFGASGSLNNYRVDLSVRDAKKILEEKFGEAPCDSGDGKVNFEYYFKSNSFGSNVYYRIYDYKGGMSCGYSVSKGFRTDKSVAEKMMRELKDVLYYVYGDILVETWKEYFERKGLN